MRIHLSDLPSRMLGWSVHRLGVYAASVLALACIVLISTASTIGDLSHGLIVHQLIAAGCVGLALGWWLGRAASSVWRAGFAVLIVDCGVFISHAGDVLALLPALWRSIAWLIGEVAQRAIDGQLYTIPFQSVPPDLSSSLEALLAQVWNRILALFSGQALHNAALATLAWVAIFFLLASWAGWALRRWKQPLLAMIPLTTLLAGCISFASGNALALLPVLGCNLLLMALARYDNAEQEWYTKGSDFSHELRFDMALMSISIVTVVVILAALLSHFSIQDLIDRLKGVEAGVVDQASGVSIVDAFTVEEDPLTKVLAPGLPRQHLLGSSAELSEQVVMVVSVDQQTSEADPTRYYWRSLTYDRYTGHGWETSETQVRDYPAGSFAHEENSVAQRTVHQTVQVLGDVGGLLHAAGTLLTSDHAYRVAWRTEDDAFAAIMRNDVYQIDSQVPLVDVTALRSAGEDYPEWIRERYLALPQNIPPRVGTLAHDLTVNASTPFDKAQSIERYLRSFPYTLDLPAPPIDRDVVDYFLFDLQTGYCDYYATAMVVLARASGIPARLAVGYYNGVYDEDNGRYIIAETDAHSWVEVYFPEVGWIDFEPTAGRPELLREENSIDPSTGAGSSFSGVNAPDINWLALLALPASAGLVVLVIFSWSTFDGWRLHRLPPSATIETLFHRLHRHARRLRVFARTGDTPYEFACALQRRVQSLEHAPTQSTDPSDILGLTDLYCLIMYSQDGFTVATQVKAIMFWKRLRRQLWSAWLRQQSILVKKVLGFDAVSEYTEVTNSADRYRTT